MTYEPSFTEDTAADEADRKLLAPCACVCCGAVMENGLSDTCFACWESEQGDDDDYFDHNEDDPDKWTCAYPGYCVMPGEHMRSECHTARDVAEEFFADDGDKLCDRTGKR